MTQVEQIPQTVTGNGPCSGRIWNWWELMNHFRAGAIATSLANISMFYAIFDSKYGGTADIENFIHELTSAAKDMRRAGMKQGADALLRIHEHVVDQRVAPYTLAPEARHARDVILSELKRRRFLRVGLTRGKYLDCAELFGPEVATAFGSASADLREAGNCLAAECGTACVFHLMRAAEIALRALAADRQIVFPKGTLDSKQWGEILTQLELYAGRLITAASSNWASEDIRQAQIRFYQQAMLECRAFNDAWRRHISHAHEGAFYDVEQATSVMNHTRRFMRMLATKIAEHSSTPEFWTAL